jgi:hypothetical protein
MWPSIERMSLPQKVVRKEEREHRFHNDKTDKLDASLMLLETLSVRFPGQG